MTHMDRKELNDEIKAFHKLENESPEGVLGKNPKVERARGKLKKDLTAFVKHRLTIDLPNSRPTDLLYVAHGLFDQYCEERMLTESMFEAPQDYVDDELYENEEEVIKAANESMVECEELLTIARELWFRSSFGWCLMDGWDF